MLTYMNRRRRSRSFRRRRETGRWAHTYAALDLGTNNCRLLVARPTRDGFRVVDAFSRIVRLGEGMSQNEGLCEAAMDRAIAALEICAAKMRRHGVDRCRSVATEACRRAANCDRFLERVAERTGLRIETISSGEEARLALSGCMPLLRGGAPRALVFDIGGGSTQLMWLDISSGQADMLGWISVPLGVVTLGERYGNDALSQHRYAEIVAEVDRHLQPFCARFDIGAAVADGAVQVLGTSGTVTTLTGLHLGLERYDRARVDGAFLDFGVVKAISDRLRGMECADRAAQPCIGGDRADLVVAGCAILEAICDRWPVGRLRVADRGVREGILLDLMRAADRETTAASHAPR